MPNFISYQLMSLIVFLNCLVSTFYLKMVTLFSKLIHRSSIKSACKIFPFSVSIVSLVSLYPLIKNHVLFQLSHHPANLPNLGWWGLLQLGSGLGWYHSGRSTVLRIHLDRRSKDSDHCGQGL